MSNIFEWFNRNLTKIFFLLIILSVGYFCLIIILPIFQIFTFINNGIIEFQGVVEELEKQLRDFNTEKIIPEELDEA